MSRDIELLKETPIPPSAEVLARKAGYRQTVRIDFDGVLANEACLEVRGAGIAGDNHYNTPRNPPYYLSVPGSIAELYLRTSVATKLGQVNARLKPLGIEVYLFDAWRPQAIQRYFHDVWFPEWLVKQQPHLAGQALVDEVEKYWAAPTAGQSSPSPHSTGAALDLTLTFSDTRQPLFMGGIFDDLTEEAWTDGFERTQAISMSDAEARANRRLLYWAMTEAGFANNPTEWWHYSWGDQLWAKLGGHPAAHYGGCNPTGRPDS
ncbi:MAG TPA: M15 family metallopeptidase [Hyphomonadaceae bacterium]|nr:M15 family metallopeptidase [Hyphomonadaceae bacterium]